ncbi:MAG: biotin--[acetyl-CoA-carboxylase] ligase [Armatimonadota bacterium]
MQYIIHRYERIPSTSDLAVTLAEGGAPEGTVVIAGSQTSGRGRHGRVWSSPAGSGLYLSLILRPDKPFADLWQTAFVLAVAACETAADLSGLPACIKWPNDILLNGRKICGILIEARKPGHDLRSPVIAGIGINVNTLEFPPEISRKATSIALETGRQTAVEDVEDRLLSAVDRWYTVYTDAGFTPIFTRWHELDCTAGRTVSVSTSGGIVDGTAVEVNPHGDLVIEHPDGCRTSVSAGEVFFRD